MEILFALKKHALKSPIPMRRYIPILATVVLLSSCSVPIASQQPKFDANAYLTQNELDRVNQIAFEVQKVLDTLSSLKKEGVLGDVTALKYPGWKIRKKTGHILFLQSRIFEAEKTFPIPASCIKNVAGAQINVCHVKLKEILTNLGKAYGCDIKAEEIKYPLGEKVIISCSY